MLNISKKAQNYIKEHGGIVHLYDMGTVGMCCGRMRLAPSVRLGEPKFPENYEIITMEGIQAYVPKALSYPHDLTIEYKRVLLFSSLYIDGWQPV